MNARNLLAALLLIASLPALAVDQLDITVTGGDIAPLPIAIVPFQQVAEVPLDVAQVIHNDLARSGRFKVLDRRDMLERPVTPQQVNNGSWKSQGMDNLVIGQVGKSADGGYYARFFLIDTISGQQILGFDIPARELRLMRRTAHQISDLIYEKLLGIPGYFSTQIAYIAASGIGASRNFQLIVADADGENPLVVATSREPLMSPSWSPDKKQLAYVGYERGRQSLYLHTLATGQVRKLASERGINGSPAFSPDGTKMALVLSFESNPDIYVMDISSGARRRLTDHYGIDTEPSWSPDGSKIVFTSDRGGQPQLYEISAGGGDPRRLSFEGRQNLCGSYSPDGKSVLLVNQDGGYRIGLLDLASGNTRILSDGPLDEHPTFSKGGAVIIYATQGAHGAELATVSVDGRVRSRLRQAGDVREPVWSP